MSTSDGGGLPSPDMLSPEYVAALANELFKGTSVSDLGPTRPPSLPTVGGPAGPPEYYFLSVPTNVAAPSALGAPPFAAESVRRDFPILEERVNGKKLVWLDNAATTQKP